MKKLIVVLALVLTLSAIARYSGAQQIVIGERVAAEQRVAMDQIDHSTWNTLLQKFVNERGQVNYAGWKTSQSDQLALDNYIKILSSASTTKPATREGQLAFWINAYNAVTVKGILREYPTSSIRKHTSKLGGYNIWKHLQLAVADTQISLDSMENDVLRKMNEPRIHFAIVCASYSCPRLLNQAYTGPTLEDQLTLNTKYFFANPENFQYDAARGKFHISSIIKWFGKDFGENQAAQLKTIAPWLPNQQAYNAAIQNNVKVAYLKYDWGLNEQKRVAQTGSGNRTEGSNRR